MQFFNSKFPIVEASMNQGSSLKLALAVHCAGAFPSLFLGGPLPLNYDNIESILAQFRSTTNGMNVVIPVDRYLLTDKTFIRLMHNYAPSHIEILPSDINGEESTVYSFLTEPQIKLALKTLRARSKIILRLYQPVTSNTEFQVDGFYIKGKESAGKTGNWTVRDLFLEQKKLTPNIPVIPYGGIGTPDQVGWYMTHGAAAVGVGTLFATCVESPLSTEVKQKIVGITRDDLTCLKDTHQNCLVMGKLNSESGWNRDNSLKEGITGNGQEGIVYLGTAVDHVTHIRTVKETVDFLCSNLQ